MGGGGAGGGNPSTSSLQYAGGGGGGGGEYAFGIFNNATLGSSQSVTIGAAGVGASGMIGGAGGTTSVGSLITAHGGSGGALGSINGQVSGGAGGTGGSGGPVRTPGWPGGTGWANYNYFQVGGQGADSQYGSGGIAQVSSSGNAASGYGAGGGGSSQIQSAGAQAGGNGTAGLVIITEYILTATTNIGGLTTIINGAGGTTVTFINLQPANYAYLVIIDDLLLSNNNVSVQMQFSTNNGGSYVNSGYQYAAASLQMTAVNAWGTSGSASDSSLEIGGGLTNLLCDSACVFITNLDTQPRVFTLLNHQNTGPANFINTVGGCLTTTGSYNAMQFTVSAGTFTTGTFALYAYPI